MSRLVCPRCDGVLSDSDINVAEGVAFCGSCKALSRLSEMVEEKGLEGVDPANPPRGCTFSSDGVRTVVTASSRNVGLAAFTLAFGAFWNGLLSIFILEATASTLHHIYGSVPTWLPSPTGGFGNSSLAMTLFMWAFLVPFIVVGVGMIAALIMALTGRVEVRLDGDRGSVFTGVGAFGLRKHFDAGAVRSVAVVKSAWQMNDKQMPQVMLKADREVRFGAGLPEQRQQWIVAVLRKILVVR